MKNKQAGFTLIEVLGALLVISIMLPVLFNLWEFGAVSLKKRQAADHLAMVNKAVSAYVRLKASELITTATPTSGDTVNINDLISASFLPLGFSSKNVFNQTYQTYIRQPRPAELQAITLTTGGQGHEARYPKFANAIIPSTASMLGAAGGFIPTGQLSGQSSNSLHGAYGGYIVDLSSLSIPNPGAGHLGAMASFDNANLGQDFLYRFAIPNRPELNAMETSLDMRDNAINNVSEIKMLARTLNAEDCTVETEGRIFLDYEQGLYLCRNGNMEIIADTGNSNLLRSPTVAKNAEFIDKPICPPETNTIPQIFVAPAMVTTDAEAPPLNAIQGFATNFSDTQWQVHLRVLNSDNTWVYPTENYGRLMVFATCSKNNP